MSSASVASAASWSERPIAPRAGQFLERASLVLTWLAAAQALLALLGEQLGVAGLRTYGFDWRPMQNSTAAALLLVSASLLLLRRRPTAGVRAAGHLLAGAALLVALSLLTQELTSMWPGSARRTPLGWIAPNAAVAVILLASALLAIDVRWPARLPPHEVLALGAGFVAFLGLLGYFYRVSELYWFSRSTAMSFPGCTAILALSTATLLARHDRGLGEILASEGLGGQAARRLIPVAVLIPTLLGLLRLLGQEARLYDTEAGTALATAATVLVFSGVAAWTGSVLGRLDAARLRTLRALQAESGARELEERRLRTVLDVLPAGVIIFDASGRLLDESREARAIWGDPRPHSRAATQPLQEGGDAGRGVPIVPEELGIAKVLQRGEQLADQEVDIVTANGAHKTILSYAAPIRDARAGIVGAVAVTVDITERKRAERELASLKNELEERVRTRTAELVAANAELEAFSSSVSHDLRAPLRWIDGFARALAEEHAHRLDASGRDYLDQLRESVQRMRELIDALLGLSRVTTRPIERERVDVSALARDIASELERDSPGRRVSWTIEESMEVDADPALLRIALDNLLRNAWKFTRKREDAHIEVGTAGEDAETTFFVRDDGVGFDASYADRLFRPFERLHLPEEFEGTGIGLALVQRIVQRHGGRVFAEGRPGEGATFYFTLAPRRSRP